MEPTGNKTIPSLLDIFSLDQIAILLGVIILIILLAILVAKNSKRIKVALGPFKIDVEKKAQNKVEEEKENMTPAYRIAVLRQPTSVSGNPATLNTLMVRVYDRDGKPLKNKRVTITLEGKESNPKYYISGSLSEISDDKGEAIFSGLSFLRRGSFSIIFHADEATAKARPFSVTPPGLDVDFAGKKFGTDEYKDTLRLAISLNKAGDKITMDGEEIN